MTRQRFPRSSRTLAAVAATAAACAVGGLLAAPTTASADPPASASTPAGVSTDGPAPGSPVAGADRYAVRSGVLKVGARRGLLANDHTPLPGGLTVTGAAGAEHGTVTVDPDGSFSYRPATRWLGWDHFTYTVTGPTGPSNTGDVAVWTGDPSITSFTVQRFDDATRAWVDVTGGQLVEGTPARLTARFSNPFDDTSSANIRFEADGTTTWRSGRVAAASETDFTVPLATTGRAWADGAPSAPVEYSAADIVPALGATPTGEGTTTEVRYVPRPVVLVPEPHESPAAFDAFRARLTATHPQWPVTVVATSSAASVADLAAAVARSVDDVQRSTGAEQVDLIAHGGAGLAARRYAGLLAGTTAAGASTVHRLVTLGTPTGGSAVADALLTVDAPRDLVGVVERSTSGVGPVVAVPGVPVTAFVGTELPLAIAAAPELTGDGSTTAAAAALGVTDVRAVPGGRDTALPSSPAVLDAVPDLLRGATPPVPSPVSAGTSRPAQVFESTRLTLAPGATTVRRDLPAVGALSVTVAGADVEARLGDATGSAAAPRRTDGLGTGVVRPAPRAASWDLVLSNPATTPVTVDVVWAATDLPGAVALARPAVDPDGRVGIVATLSGLTPVVGNVLATLADGDGVTEVPMFDDGAHGDGAAADGVWAATSPPLAAGVRAVAVRARTTSGLRVTAATVTVGDPDGPRRVLTTTATSNGRVTTTVDPAYRDGAVVRLQAAPVVAGAALTGWRVDGTSYPAGDLRLVMDRDHAVVAVFTGTAGPPVLRVPTQVRGLAGRPVSVAGTMADDDTNWRTWRMTAQGTQPVAVEGNGTFTWTTTYAVRGSYPVTLTAFDGTGRKVTRTVTVTVANAPPVVTDLQAAVAVPVGGTLHATAVVDDEPLETHTATWKVGSTTVTVPVSDHDPDSRRSVATLDLPVTAAGVHDVSLVVTDADGARGRATSSTGTASVTTAVYTPTTAVAAHGRLTPAAGSCVDVAYCAGSGEAQLDADLRWVDGRLDGRLAVALPGGRQLVSTAPAYVVVIGGVAQVRTPVLDQQGTGLVVDLTITPRSATLATVRILVRRADSSVTVFDSRPTATTPAAARGSFAVTG